MVLKNLCDTIRLMLDQFIPGRPGNNLEFSRQNITDLMTKDSLNVGILYLQGACSREMAYAQLVKLIHASQQTIIMQLEQVTVDMEKRSNATILRINQQIAIPYSTFVSEKKTFIGGIPSNNVCVSIIHPEYGVASANFSLMTPDYVAEAMLIYFECSFRQGLGILGENEMEDLLFQRYLIALSKRVNETLSTVFEGYTQLVSVEEREKEELSRSPYPAEIVITVNDEDSVRHLRRGVDSDNLTAAQASIINAVTAPAIEIVMAHVQKLGNLLTGDAAEISPFFSLGTTTGVAAVPVEEESGKMYIHRATVDSVSTPRAPSLKLGSSLKAL